MRHLALPLTCWFKVCSLFILLLVKNKSGKCRSH
uniref:Uncharacterized protein n=1 Tax=Arundo donax TaxID=35708 RepID=A0A0A9EFM5_ARUDO